MIVVGRDYDAEPDYWAEVKRRNLSTNAAIVDQNLATAQGRVQNDLSSRNLPQDGGWYERRALKSGASGKPTRISGVWATGLDPAKCGFRAEAKLSAKGHGANEVPLTVLQNGEWTPFVTIETVRTHAYKNGNNESQRIFVENGSFLLNYALINKEHRKLADRLIRRIVDVDPNNAPGSVVFLESGHGGPEIRTNETLASFETGWDLFKVQPLGAFLCHLGVLGIIFCFVRWPIFGRPKADARETSLDFGQHLTALSRLLRRTGDRGFAEGRLAQYQAAEQNKKKRG
ncbi:MAG: hypothetical protein QM811_00325 [Pirellulales bacterium]